MGKFKIPTWIIVFLALLNGYSFASETSAVEIMRSVVDQRRTNSEKVDIVMTLIDNQGKKWIRTGRFYMARKDSENDVRLFHFFTPPELAKSGILTIENSSGVHDQWLYLPAYHTTRRIAGGNRGEKYMGTDFFYEDIIRIRVDEYKIIELRKEVKDGINSVVLEGIPVADRLKEESAYSKIIWWVDPQKKTMLGAKYFDKKGNVLKLLENSDLEFVKGHYIWKKQLMFDVQNNHKTILEFGKKEIDEPISPDMFTLRYLKRAQ